MKFYFNIALLFFITVLAGSCGSPKPVQSVYKPKPEWVNNRPVNTDFYVGVGTVSKSNHKTDYQQIAKKNAMDDLVSEIKVTVSTNSVLKSVQNNMQFNQQFNSTTKITALNTIEKFDVVDSWENENEFWIYYRLSKADYEEMKRRKMQAQIDRAENFLQRADQLNIHIDFIQMLHMKIQALATLQNYLNEPITSSYKGNAVNLQDAIFNSIQDQLYEIKYKTSVDELKGVIGKPLPVFNTTALLNDGSMIPNLPLKAGSDGANAEAYDHIETDRSGIATFTKAKVRGAGSTQFLRVVVDVETIILSDSLNYLVKSILLSMQPPPVSIKVAADPLKIFVIADEQNLSKPLDQTAVEPVLKKELADNGCVLVAKRNDADYVIRINSNTVSLGVLWGIMLSSEFSVTLSLEDAKTGIKVYNDGIQNIKGFQTTPENAGLDATKKGIAEANRKLIPTFVNAVLSGGN